VPCFKSRELHSPAGVGESSRDTAFVRRGAVLGAGGGLARVPRHGRQPDRPEMSSRASRAFSAARSARASLYAARGASRDGPGSGPGWPRCRRPAAGGQASDLQPGRQSDGIKAAPSPGGHCQLEQHCQARRDRGDHRGGQRPGPQPQQAQAQGQRRCIACGAKLEVAESVDADIGLSVQPAATSPASTPPVRYPQGASFRASPLWLPPSYECLLSVAADAPGLPDAVGPRSGSRGVADTWIVRRNRGARCLAPGLIQPPEKPSRRGGHRNSKPAGSAAGPDDLVPRCQRLLRQR
jgi:hypothetical protein